MKTRTPIHPVVICRKSYLLHLITIAALLLLAMSWTIASNSCRRRLLLWQAIRGCWTASMEPPDGIARMARKPDVLKRRLTEES